jgi:hypothetical protein
MAGHEPTTEAALTRELPEELREAWERLRETAADFGEQRIYASHRSIMFSRRTCYFFVRPRTSALEVVFFLRRVQKSPQVRRTERPSRTKVAHVVRIRHRDEVEPPITDWLREAYETGAVSSPRTTAPKRPASKKKTAKAGSKKTAGSKKRTAGKKATTATRTRSKEV